jgi:L-fuconolactonase
MLGRGSSLGGFLRVDAHHHLWRYSLEEYGWIDDAMHALRRDFLPVDLAEACASANVKATVAVQARQTLEETQWLLELALAHPLIRGVVGWADIAASDFSATLDALSTNSLLKGLRHVVQAERDGFLDGEAFNRGIRLLHSKNLVYDVLLFARQLPEAIRFIDRHPEQIFVLDHIAKPAIAAGEIDTWRTDIRELARRPNVSCKLSGMITEANWRTWNPALLQPYFDTVLEAFGPPRLMAGSDWPVLNVAGSYTQWWQVIENWLAPLSLHERAQVEGLTASRVYNLSR